MKLYENNFPVQVSGADSGTSQFSIAMNAKAFRVLSDTLYQDKPGSLVREISTNAYDGHIMAGKKDVPFEIHLPDNFEPWFSVRDFGVGLSPESVRTIFTTYFMSTKDNSNDAVGAFGLGAKTPFAYTDQFTIESNYNGVKTIYSAFIDGSGIPNIAEMFSGETEEINGVEIKVAVKQEDFQTFRNAVATQLRFFDVKPIVKNCEHFTFAKVVEPNETSIVGTDYIVTEGTSELIVIQGQIGYPVSTNKLNKILTSEFKHLIELVNSRLSIKLTFAIGEIGVTASRESIEYDDRTVRNILKKLEVIQKDIAVNVENKLSSITNGWDRICAISGMYFHFKASYEVKYDNVLRERYGSNYQISIENSKLNFFTVGETWDNRILKTTTRYLPIKNNVRIIIVNANVHNREAIRSILRKNKDCSHYMVYVDKNADIKSFIDETSKYLLGISTDKFILHSDYVVKKPRAARVSTPKTLFYSINSALDYGREHNEELPDEFIYVEFKRGKPSEEDNVLISEFFLMKGMDEFKDSFNLPLIGIPVSEMKKINGEDVVKLSDFIKQAKELAPVDAIAKKHRRAKVYEVVYDVFGDLNPSIRQTVIESKTEYGKLLEVLQNVVNDSEYSTCYDKYRYETILNVFNIKTQSNSYKLAEKLRAKSVKLKSKIPVLDISERELAKLDKQYLIKLLQVSY